MRKRIHKEVEIEIHPKLEKKNVSSRPLSGVIIKKFSFYSDGKNPNNNRKQSITKTNH